MIGQFITIYGINNIGKTYHSRRLVERLRKLGRHAVYLKYPIYNEKPTGPYINNILRTSKKQKMTEEELQLWFVLNRYQFQPKLMKMLKEGSIVVAEDYVGTGIPCGTAKGANLKELENMNKFLVQPDVSILMDGKRVLEAKERGHLHEEDEILIEKCQKMYRKLARKYKWKIVSVDTDKDVTAARIWKAIQPLVDGLQKGYPESVY